MIIKKDLNLLHTKKFLWILSTCKLKNVIDITKDDLKEVETSDHLVMI